MLKESVKSALCRNPAGYFTAGITGGELGEKDDGSNRDRCPVSSKECMSGYPSSENPKAIDSSTATRRDSESLCNAVIRQVDVPFGNDGWFHCCHCDWFVLL